MSDRADIVAAAVTMVFAGAAFYFARSFSPGASIFPSAIAMLMFVAGLGLFSKSLYRVYRPKTLAVEDGAPSLVIGRLGIAVCLTGGYVVSVFLLGFYLSSIMLVIASPYLLGYYNHKQILVTAVVFVAVMYLLFEIAFQISLPRGLVI